MEELKIEFKPVGLKLDTDREHFAVALRMWRVRHGLTQREAAKRIGVSRHSIIRCEGGKEPSMWMMYKIFCVMSQDQ